MAYTLVEQETIIRSDNESKLWTIYTHQQKVITKLRKAGVEPWKVDDDGAHHYKDLKFNQVSFRNGKQREYTDEQREKHKERGRNLNKNKNI